MFCTESSKNVLVKEIPNPKTSDKQSLTKNSDSEKTIKYDKPAKFIPKAF